MFSITPCKKKLLTTLCVVLSAAAFATLGDGKGKRTAPAQGNLLSLRNHYNFQGFSLRSGFHYSADRLLDQPEQKFIMLNTTVTYQKGNTTYILPMKRKVFLDKVKFNPY